MATRAAQKPVNRREKLHELKRRRAQQKAAYLALIDKMQQKADDGDDEDAADRTALDDIKADITAIDARVADVEAALEMESDESEEVEGSASETEERSMDNRLVEGGRMTFAEARKTFPEEKGYKLARFLIGVTHSKLNRTPLRESAQFIENRFGDLEVAKALNTAGQSVGGALIPQSFQAEIIDLLRARVAIRNAGPTIVPMPFGNLTIPRLAAGATAGYQGELDDIAPSQETFDDLQLNAKKLTALVPVSNDLVRRSPIGVEQIVRNDLLATIARREDLAFMRGDGSGNSPVGLLNQCATANKLVVTAFTATDNATMLTAVVAVLTGMRLTMEQSMSTMTRPVWIFAPQIKWFLTTLRDQVGNFVFKDELMGGTLMGLPFFESQQLPTNLTNGQATGNVTEMYLVDMSDVVLAETFNMAVDSSDVAAYKDSGGNMVSSYQRDQTLFRVINEHDLALRHQASLVIAQVPAWAPAGYAGQSAGNAYFVQTLNTSSSAAASTFGSGPPTGSNNPANSSVVGAGGTQPGHI